MFGSRPPSTSLRSSSAWTRSSCAASTTPTEPGQRRALHQPLADALLRPGRGGLRLEGPRRRSPRSMRDGDWLVGWGCATASYPTLVLARRRPGAPDRERLGAGADRRARRRHRHLHGDRQTAAETARLADAPDRRRARRQRVAARARGGRLGHDRERLLGRPDACEAIRDKLLAPRPPRRRGPGRRRRRPGPARGRPDPRAERRRGGAGEGLRAARRRHPRGIRQFTPRARSPAPSGASTGPRRHHRRPDGGPHDVRLRGGVRGGARPCPHGEIRVPRIVGAFAGGAS